MLLAEAFMDGAGLGEVSKDSAISGAQRHKKVCSNRGTRSPGMLRPSWELATIFSAACIRIHDLLKLCLASLTCRSM